MTTNNATILTKRTQNQTNQTRTKSRNTYTPKTTAYMFPKVKIRLLNHISSYEDIDEKSILYSFESVWVKYIKNNLIG